MNLCDPYDNNYTTLDTVLQIQCTTVDVTVLDYTLTTSRSTWTVDLRQR